MKRPCIFAIALALCVGCENRRSETIEKRLTQIQDGMAAVKVQIADLEKLESEARKTLSALDSPETKGKGVSAEVNNGRFVIYPVTVEQSISKGAGAVTETKTLIRLDTWTGESSEYFGRDGSATWAKIYDLENQADTEKWQKLMERQKAKAN